MKKIVCYISIVLIVLLFWHYFGTTFGRIRMLISTPAECYEYFLGNKYLILKSTGITFMESVLGLIVATTFAFLLMIVCFKYKGFFKTLLPFVVGSQVIPVIVLAPFFIILFGLGIISKVLMAALISFFPIFLNFASGYNSISQNVHDLADTYNTPLLYRIFSIYFPISTPQIFAGLKVAVPLSIIGAIVAEMVGSEIGLGLNFLKTQFRTEPELLIWSIIGSAFIGLILYKIIELMERKYGDWYLNKTKQLM